jgi:hypothetical protein
MVGLLMTIAAIILFASPVILLAVTVLFAVIVIGIRRGDRGDLRRPAHNRIDAIGRRAAGVGTRNDTTEEGES